MVGVGASGVDDAGWVTNASNKDVGVGVRSSGSVGVGSFWTNTSVEYTSGIGDGTISGIPPWGVGV